MPLDTRSKRASSVQLMKPSFVFPPMPDGTISQGDQQHTALNYSGIPAGSFVPPPVNASTGDYITRARRRGRR
jgi:hypothetical protein